MLGNVGKKIKKIKRPHEIGKGRCSVYFSIILENDDDDCGSVSKPRELISQVSNIVLKIKKQKNIFKFQFKLSKFLEIYYFIFWQTSNGFDFFYCTVYHFQILLSSSFVTIYFYHDNMTKIVQHDLNMEITTFMYLLLVLIWFYYQAFHPINEAFLLHYDMRTVLSP